MNASVSYLKYICAGSAKHLNNIHVCEYVDIGSFIIISLFDTTFGVPR